MDINLVYSIDNIVLRYLVIGGLYGSIVGIIIFIAGKILKNKISKKYLCALWFIFLFKLIFPYGPESSFGLFNIPSLNNSTNTIQDNKLYENQNYDDSEIYSFYNLNNYGDLSKNEVVESTDNNESLDENFKYDIAPNSNITYYDQEEEWDFSILMNLDILIVILVFLLIEIVFKFKFWIMLGIEVLMILAYMFIYFRFKKKLIIYPEKSDRVENIFKNTLKRMNINRKIELIITDSVNTPSLIGIFKVKVLLPNNLIDLEDYQLEYIFLHELCHYKRKDNILNYLLVVLQCLHLFNIVV